MISSDNLSLMRESETTTIKQVTSLSIDHCRKILGKKSSTLSDEQIQQLIQELSTLAQIFIKEKLKEGI